MPVSTISVRHGGQKVLTYIAIACAVAIGIHAYVLNAGFFHDDAYITLRYVRNSLEGNGVVWNPGERVQGFTSGLQLALMWVLGRCGLDLVLAAQAIGLISLIVLLLGVVWLQRRLYTLDRGDPFWAVPIVLVVTSHPLIVWAGGGLESLLFCLLAAASLILLVLAVNKPAARLPVIGMAACLGLACITRPDGIVFVAVCGGWLLLCRKGTRLSDTILFGLVWLACVIPYGLWQYLYYGSVVPNTYYAKIGLPLGLRLANGLRYLAEFATTPPYLPILLAVLLVAVARRRAWSVRLACLVSVVLAQLFYVVVAGGDHMPAFRLFLPAIVPMVYAVYLAMRALLPRPGQWGTGISLAMVVLAALQVRSGILNPGTDRAALVGELVGRYIDAAWPAGSLVALNTAGSTPYYASRLRFIDMLGLNDPHIARRPVDSIAAALQKWSGHAKGDGRYVLSRDPDYVILGTAEGVPSQLSAGYFLSDVEIVADPRFAARYRMRRIPLDQASRVAATLDAAVVGFTYYERIRD